MLASHRDGKYLEAIEKITGNKLARREMMDIEVREERKSPRGEHGRGSRDRGKERGRCRDGKQRDRRPPDGKYHDQVAGMEPVEVKADAASAATPAMEPVRAPAAEARAPREHKPRNEPRPGHRQERQEQRPHSEPRHEPREKRDRGSQRHHNEQAARPEAVDKSELPAFLFRPVPVKKPEPQS
jgi:hypothetical protein